MRSHCSTFSCSLVEESNSEADFRFDSNLRVTWTCAKCERTLVVNNGERLEHQGRCQGDEDRLMRAETNSGPSAQRRTFHCDVCGGEFAFSSVEAIKHRKECSKAKEEKV